MRSFSRTAQLRLVSTNPEQTPEADDSLEDDSLRRSSAFHLGTVRKAPLSVSLPRRKLNSRAYKREEE